MHPRNPYCNPPDFEVLAAAYPLLKPHLKYVSKNLRLDQLNKATIDYNDEDAQRRLTEALLCHTFKLNLTLPPARLCPPVPNRLNYILWLQDIVVAHRRRYNLVYGEPGPLIYGFDAGTGASAIYPLLGCAMDSSWRFLATELDPLSFDYATQNVNNNNLEDRIHVRKVDSPQEPLFAVMTSCDEIFDFAMCNPPFYRSVIDLEQSARDKSKLPNAICTGSEVEMITEGGEVAFVSRMVEESRELQSRCRWFTSMLGKLSSVPKIIELFQHLSISNYGLTEFVQGQTRRWAVAWSYTDVRLPDNLLRINSPSIQALLPPRNSIHHDLTLKPSMSHHHGDTLFSEVGEYHQHLIQILSSLDQVCIIHQEDTSLSRHSPHPQFSMTEPQMQNHDTVNPNVIISAQRNTWSRRARRKKESSLSSAAGMLPSRTPVPSPVIFSGSPSMQASMPTSELVCAMTWHFLGVNDTSKCAGREGMKRAMVGHDLGTKVRLEFVWLYGKDWGLFESFSGCVARKLGEGAG